MTAAHLAQRLCTDWLSVRDPSDLAVDHKTSLLDAINSGIGKYFARVPHRFRCKPFGARFGASFNTTGTATNGSRVITIASAPLDGATVVLSGDAVKNRYFSEDGVPSLEIPYGGTTGAVTITCYRDVVDIPWEIACFASPPRHMITGEQLIEVGPGPDDGAFIGGHVHGYRVERAGAKTVMRLLPLQSGDFPVGMEVELVNAGLINPSYILGVTGVAALPFSDDHATRIVMPLCAGELIRHPCWRKDDKGNRLDVDLALSQAQAALAEINLLRPVISTGRNRICAPFP